MVSRDLVNVSEAARRAGVSRSSVKRWVAAEQLFPVGQANGGEA